MVAIIEERIVLQSIQNQTSVKVRKTFRHLQFAFSIPAKGIVIVPNRDAERSKAVAFVEVEVLHHAVAIVGEHEQQMPIDDVLQIENVANFAGEGAVICMNHELHDIFQIAVQVLFLNVGKVLLEVIAWFLNPFQSVFTIEQGRILENHGEAVFFVKAKCARIEFLHEYIKPVIFPIFNDVYIGTLGGKVPFRIHLPEQVETELVAHHGLVDVVGIQDIGTLQGKTSQFSLSWQFEGVRVLRKTTRTSTSASDFGAFRELHLAIGITYFARQFLVKCEGLGTDFHCRNRP